MSSPVKFIFNTPAAGSIYKYGAVGLIWLFFIMIRIQKRYSLNGWRLALLYLLYLVMLFPGFLKINIRGRIFVISRNRSSQDGYEYQWKNIAV